ncbi:LamG domain-containing protein [Streptomyces sp. NPDC006733]|uniref:LamG domain-containing protein n=1 Tax=Streptomyces sp. NPDC006733 TaxID=3155460 RepID=UPI0033D05F82
MAAVGVLIGLPDVARGVPQAAAADTAPPTQPGTGAGGSAPHDTPESLAIAAAKRTNTPVDVATLTTEISDVQAQPDGTLVSTTHVVPVRTRQSGTWAPIDTALRVRSDGTVAPKAALADLVFSGGGTQPLVRMSRAGKELALTWPKALPKPLVSESTVEYRSVLPDVDLRLTATATGFTQLLVVKTAQAAKNPELNQLKLGLAGQGLTVNEHTDGSLAAVDAGGGGTVFEAPRPVMYDSSALAQSGAPGPVAAAPAASAATSPRVGNRTATTTAPNASAVAPAPTQSAAPVTTPSATPTSTSPTSAPTTDSSPATPRSTTGIDGAAHTAPVDVDLPADHKSLVLTPDQGLLDAPTTVFPVMIDPVWNTPVKTAWTGVSQYWNTHPYWHFGATDNYDFGVGYCGDTSLCAPQDRKRVMYEIPSAQFAGKHVLSATFSVYESHSYSCTDKNVQLWLTNRISSKTTWDTSQGAFWNSRLQTLAAAKGYTGCAAGNLEFGGASGAVRNQVQAAANGGWTSITFGLRAENENDTYAWKRFTAEASLRVLYNLPPRQAPMKDLSMSPGSLCLSTGVQINKMPQITAKVSDPDGEKIGIQFGVAWDTGDGKGTIRRWWSTGAEATAPAANTFKASGSLFSVSLPTSLPLNKWLGWEVRAWDGAEWGPWSSTGDPTDCYVMVDTTTPAGPVITSSSYPGSSDAQAVLPWTDGVGRYGAFTVDSVATDVVKYQWGLDTTASAANQVSTTAGAPQTVNVLPTTVGPHLLSVRALDGAGNASQPQTYYFNVAAGHPQRSGWAMDETSGTQLTGTGGTFEATPASGATLGAAGHTGTALALDGTANGYAATPGAVLDTARGYSVSAWVNLADANAAVNRGAVSQDGTYIGAFTLGLSDGKWAFKTTTKDAEGYDWQTAASTAPVVTGQWTHLVGVYDAVAKTNTVYVNGVASAPAAAPAAWAARGSLQFGRLFGRGVYTDAWPGSLDEVHLFDRALTASEATKVAADQALTTGTPAKAVWPLDDTATPAIGRSETTDAALFGGATPGAAGVAGKAVHFDGVNDYARTTRPQIEGTRSFSVSAWVKLPTIKPGDYATRMALTQGGLHNSEFALYYAPDTKKWVFGRYKDDITADTLVRALQPTCTTTTGGIPCFGANDGQWTHLLGVSDATAGKIRLYINGYLVGESAYTQTKPWSTPGSLQIGAGSREGVAGEFFGGDIDDVRLFDRVVTDPEARDMVQQRPQLAGRWKLNTATGTPQSSPDDITALGGQRTADPAVLGSSALIDPAEGVLNPTGALQLDGTATAYASTAGTNVRTGESFSLTGWAQTAGTPSRDMTVWSVAGSSSSALTVRWDYVRTDTDPLTEDPIYVGRWVADVAGADGSTTRTTAAFTFDGGAAGSSWTHLAVVYDAFADQLTLYVNGQTQNFICPDDAGAGTCSNNVSWSTAAQPFIASGGLQIGRNRAGAAWTEPFSGEIDDVWAYQGVLSPTQIYILATPGNELDTATGP